MLSSGSHFVYSIHIFMTFIWDLTNTFIVKFRKTHKIEMKYHQILSKYH